MALELELEHFNSIKAELLKSYKGKFALIKGKKLLDTFTTSEEAYQAGVKQFGAVPFLIKQIIEEDPVESIPALTVGSMYAHP